VEPRKARLADVREPTVEDTGRYGVIYADPPLEIRG
jgi:hypothetical protein